MDQVIPIFDLKRQIASIRKELDEAIDRVVTGGQFIFGQDIALLEQDVAAYCGCAHAIGVSNGTDALRLALVALGVKPGDAVACPSFTYFATAGAIAAVGAKPVFTDIDPLTYTISLASLQEALTKKGGKKIKAVIPVHLYGQCADLDAVSACARAHNLKVLEDNAQAFGADYKGKKAGSLGDCAGVSFFPGKNLGALGDAGMILTNASRYDAMTRLLRNQGNKDKYYHLVLGHNNRLDTLQAAVLRVKLAYIDGWNKKRQEHAAYYNESFAGLPLKLPYVAPYSTHTYHQYVVRVKGSSAKLMQHLKNRGIEARVYYPVPQHLQSCFEYLGYKKGDFPASEKASKETLALPIFPELTRQELERVVMAVKEFFRC